jgi:hypothetical protein
MGATMAETQRLAGFAASHVILHVDGGIAEITLNRPERKNPLTFESYRELVAIFRAAKDDPDVKAFILAGAGGNFSSGGDVHDIIAPLLDMKTSSLLDFTRMTGDLVYRQCQGRLPVQPRRPCRLRHGCLRHPAAHHWPRPCI